MNYKLSIAKKYQVEKWIPIALIILLATVLRLYQLSTEGLWVDEMFSIRAAESFNLSKPGTRPLYFIILRLWMQLGTSDAWLRGLAVIFGIGSVFFTYQLGRRVAREQTALMAAFLMALSPLFLWHSQEIRMYTLSTFLTVGGTLALTHALKHPSNASLGWWAVARLLAILTTPLNVTLLLPDTVLFGWKYRLQRRWLLAFGMGLMFIGIFCFPAAFELTTKSGPEFMSGHVAEKPKPNIIDIALKLTTFTAFWPLKPLKANAIALGYYQLYTIILVSLLGIALFIAFKNRHRYPQLLWVAAWALLPASFILFISYIKSSIWVDRYLLFVSPYLFILLAAGLLQVWHWQRQFALLLATAYIIAVGGGLVNYYTTLHRNDWRGVAQIISINEKPDDVIVYYAPWPDNDESLTRYYDGSLQLYHIDKTPQNETWGTSLREQQLSKLSPIKSRLWLVCWLFCNQKEDLESIKKTVVGEKFQIEKHEVFSSIETATIELFMVR